MAAWGRVKAKMDDEMAGSQPPQPMNGQSQRRASVTPGDNERPQASPALPVGGRASRVNYATRLRERERQAWGMSEEERK